MSRRRERTNIIEQFKQEQTYLLNEEKYFYRRQLEEKKRTSYARIINDFVEPFYGGVIVTFLILKLEEDKDENETISFKSRSPIVIAPVGMETVFRGTIVLVRQEEICVHLKLCPSLLDKNRIFEVSEADDDEFDILLDVIANIRPAGTVPLVDILFDLQISTQNQRKLNFTEDDDNTENEQLNFFNEKLDESQREAVEFCMQQNELAMIHGPPGTGKTTTLVEIIKQEVKNGKKILFSAVSNVAVDNMTEILADENYNVVRVGNPARVSKRSQDETLDFKVQEEASKLREIQATILNLKLQKANPNSIASWEEERKKMKQEFAIRVSSELREADVVLGTLVACSDEMGPLKCLAKNHFDVTIIDECSQAKEASCWIVVPKAPKLILAGDHMQLPPVIHNVHNNEVQEQLSISLMQRLLKQKKTKKTSRKLRTQYRMNELIMKWPSAVFYQNKLIAHHSVANNTLKDTRSVKCNSWTEPVLILIDTKDHSVKYESPKNKSFFNKLEVHEVHSHILKLTESGVKPSQIGVISPYAAQIEVLCAQLGTTFPDIEFKTVDGFQGREKDVIILTLVRSNSQNITGFIGNKKRLNVSITRAKKQLVLVCDTQTVSNEKLIFDFLNFLRKQNRKHLINKSVSIFPADPNNNFSLFKPPQSEEAAKIRRKIRKEMMDNNLPKLKLNRNDKIVGIDCEMVESEDSDVLARVSIVTRGTVLMSSFVACNGDVTNYNTEISGVSEADLIDAPGYPEVVEKVRKILEDADIIVGHGLDHDMKVLGFEFPEEKVRDTSTYPPFLKKGGRTPSLKGLAMKYLDQVIQQGSHNPEEDARAALNIYLMFRQEWEERLYHVKFLQENLNSEGQDDEILDFDSNNRYGVLEDH